MKLKVTSEDANSTGTGKLEVNLLTVLNYCSDLVTMVLSHHSNMYLKISNHALFLKVPKEMEVHSRY